jgi:hypothetical protein
MDELWPLGPLTAKEKNYHPDFFHQSFRIVLSTHSSHLQSLHCYTLPPLLQRDLYIMLRVTVLQASTVPGNIDGDPGD